MRLLVSVRSVVEARAALDGGADLIDVKEPAHGPLGRADDEVIVAIARVVAGTRLMSAALGELNDSTSWNLPPALATTSNLAWRGVTAIRGESA